MSIVLEWHEEEITVPVLPMFQADNGVTKTVAMQVLGEWGYHPLIGDPIWAERGHCDVTHIPTGQSISIRASKPDEARRIVEALQGLEVKTFRRLDNEVKGTPETLVAILERIIPIAGDMELGLYRPGDLRVEDLVKTADKIRAKIAKRN